MKRLGTKLAACLLNVIGWNAAQGADGAALVSGGVWRDDAGRIIQAHAGGMLHHGGVYYWYGQDLGGPNLVVAGVDRVDVRGIRAYSSRDLVTWHDEGLVLRAVPEDPPHDLHPSKVCERPKVVHNPRTKQFVMWMHIDTADYKAARAGVAVADAPTGPFRYIESVRPEGQDSRDQTLFQDDDGTAYRIYSSENNATTYISQLTDDYLRHSGRFARVFVGRNMEAQAVFKRAGKYYLVASGTTGWDPNPARSAEAESIWGPWTEFGNPCRGPGAETTFGGQSTFVLPVAGQPDLFVFMADRWNKTNLSDSRYFWLPIRFRDRGFEVPWRDAWRGIEAASSPTNPTPE